MSSLITAEWKYLYARELRSYFNTPIGYVFAVVSLFLAFLLFFVGWPVTSPFFQASEATVRGFMDTLPLIFVFFVPAIAMRIWAEERKSGTIELLSTLPLRETDLVVAKFLAAWSYVGGLVLASLPLAVSVALIGDHFDWGAHLALYIGSLLMAGAYVSMGMVISALTREQIVAFILVFFASAYMYVGGLYWVTRLLPRWMVEPVQFFSLSSHFDSFSRGLLYAPDLFFYVSFIILMLAINVWILRAER